MAKSVALIYCPFPNHEAAVAAAEALLEARLVACANILPGVTSLYHWQGSVAQESEVLLIAKTTPDLAPRAMQALAKQHPYEVPAIICVNDASANAAFAAWVANETNAPA